MDEALKDIPAHLLRDGLRRERLAKAWEEYERLHPDQARMVAMEAFIAQVKHDTPHERLSRTSLFRWLRWYRAGGLAGLCRGTGRLPAERHLLGGGVASVENTPWPELFRQLAAICAAVARRLEAEAAKGE